MTQKQEIKKLLKTKGKAFVDERIIPELLDNITGYAGELSGKIEKIDPEDSRQAERIYDRIYTDLIGETIRRLIKFQYERRK